MKAIERLFKYLDFKQLKPTPFEAKVGLSNGYLGKQRKRNADLGESVLVKIIDYCQDLDSVWLLTGKGNMFLQDNLKTDLKEILPHGNIGGKHPISPLESNMGDFNQVYKLQTDRSLDNQEIPLYDIEATAGIVALFNSQKEAVIIDTIKIPNLPKCDGAVFVTGDSMYPLLKSGDIVAYKEIYDKVNSIFWGEMYLVSIDVEGEEYISVKYIQKSDKGEQYVKLVSQNQHHQPKDVHIDKIGALGIVKASIRINAMG